MRLTFLLLILTLTISQSFGQIDTCLGYDSTLTEFKSYRDISFNDTNCLVYETNYFPKCIPEILQKVFPQVVFILKDKYFGCIPGEGERKPLLYFRYDSVDYFPYHSFNYLISKMVYEEKLEIEDKINAYLTILKFPHSLEHYDKIEIQTLELYEFEYEGCNFNYKSDISINGNEETIYLRIIDEGIYLVAIKRDHPNQTGLRICGFEIDPSRLKNAE